MVERDWDSVVSRAQGHSVTTERLFGESQYFVDCHWILDPDEQPHHLLCLTTGVQEEWNAAVSVGDTIEIISRHDEASILFTDRAIHVIFEDGSLSYLYTEIAELKEFEGPSMGIQTGHRNYYFEIARHASSDFAVADAMAFAKEQIKKAQYQAGSVTESEALDDLERLSELLESGVISEDECEMLKRRIFRDR